MTDSRKGEKMNQQKFEKIVSKHATWIKSKGKQGKQVCLKYGSLDKIFSLDKDLREASFEGSFIEDSNFGGCDFFLQI